MPKKPTKSSMTKRLDDVCRRIFVAEREVDGKIECDKCEDSFPYGVIGINLAHIESRGGKFLRWCPENFLALCNGPGTNNCHYWFDHNKVASSRWLEENFPEKAEWLSEEIDGKPRSATLFTEKIPWMIERERELRSQL